MQEPRSWPGQGLRFRARRRRRGARSGGPGSPVISINTPTTPTAARPSTLSWGRTSSTGLTGGPTRSMAVAAESGTGTPRTGIPTWPRTRCWATSGRAAGTGSCGAGRAFGILSIRKSWGGGRSCRPGRSLPAWSGTCRGTSTAAWASWPRMQGLSAPSSTCSMPVTTTRAGTVRRRRTGHSPSSTRAMKAPWRPLGCDAG